MRTSSGIPQMIGRSVGCLGALLCLSLFEVGCGSSKGGAAPAPSPSMSTATSPLQPSLVANVSHTGNFRSGQDGATYSVTVRNNGTGPTSGTVTVTDSVPAAMMLVSMAGSGWLCNANTCSRADVLAATGVYPPITVTVDVLFGASGSIVNQVSVWSGGVLAAASDAATIDVYSGSVSNSLSVSVTHEGDFSAGQGSAQYQVTVSNPPSAAGPTAGVVVVNLSGLLGWANSVNGWSCASLRCTRSDPLPPGQSYPPIVYIVDIPENSPSPVVVSAEAQVLGDDSPPASASDSAVVGGPSACASLPSGNESVMNGQYAAVAQGWQGRVSATPDVMAFSVALDGAGKIEDLGGGIGGDLDINDAVLGPRHLTINSAGSLYTLGGELGGPQQGQQGTKSVGYIGCLRLQTSGGAFTFVFAPGGFTSGVATKGGILQINDESGTKSYVSGELRIQEPSAFSSGDASALPPYFAFGEHGGDPTGRFAMAGSFVLDPQSGAVSSVTADRNEAGVLSGFTGAGSIASVSSVDGRALLSLSSLGPPAATSNSVLYIVNSNEMFMVGTEPFAPGSPIRSGQAIVSANSYAVSSIFGNQIIHAVAQGAGGALGLLNLSPISASTGTYTGIVFQYASGLETTSIDSGSPGTYTVDSTTGRGTLQRDGATKSVLYLASPMANTDPVSFFILGVDPIVSFGSAEQGASAPVADKLLSGVFFLMNDDSGDVSVGGEIGIVADLRTPIGTLDYVSKGSQSLNGWPGDYASIAITNLEPNGNPAPGVGGAVGDRSIVAITNGKRVLCLFVGGDPKQTYNAFVSNVFPGALLIAEP
jgi:uncharacterized repeat protein (TIGR01451 family)